MAAATRLNPCLHLRQNKNSENINNAVLILIRYRNSCTSKKQLIGMCNK